LDTIGRGTTGKGVGTAIRRHEWDTTSADENDMTGERATRAAWSETRNVLRTDGGLKGPRWDERQTEAQREGGRRRQNEREGARRADGWPGAGWVEGRGQETGRFLLITLR
jgi:hypothetical protein